MTIENQFTLVDIDEQNRLSQKLPAMTQPKRDLSQPDDYFAVEEEKQHRPKKLEGQNTASF